MKSISTEMDDGWIQFVPLTRTSTTTISDLTNDDLAAIFKYLSFQEEREILTVCERWLRILNERFMELSCIVLSKDLDYSPNGSLYSTFHNRITKDIRKFHRIRIKSFPSDMNSFLALTRFIELVGDEIKCAEIEEILMLDVTVSKNTLNGLLYAKMPKLEVLNLCDEVLLGNMTLPDRIQSIEVQNGLVIHSWPDCQRLKMENFYLEDFHFRLICEYMPRIKCLHILNGMGENRITLHGLLDNRNHSLKNLTNLDEFVFETACSGPAGNRVKWPALPNLRTLSLSGKCFSHLKEDFYTDLATLSPRITNLRIDTQGRQIATVTFLPIFHGLYLTSLEIPGEYDEFVESNSFLVSILLQQCDELQSVCVAENSGFTFAQEIKLFEAIPTLNTISSIITYRNLSKFVRKINRSDLFNLKDYLKRNLQFYRDLEETVDCLLNNVLTNAEVSMLYAVYLDTYPEEDFCDGVRKLYIIFAEYLGLTEYEICRLICKMKKN